VNLSLANPQLYSNTETVFLADSKAFPRQVSAGAARDGAVKLGLPAIFTMVEGADLDPIRIQIEGVGPDRVALHAVIVNIDDPIGVDVDEGGIAGFSGRGVGMTGHPEKDLGVGDQEHVHPGRRLDDGIGTIDIVPESGLGPVKRGVGEDDGWLVAVPEELNAEPCQLRFADAGAKTVMIGGEKKEQVTVDFQLVVVLAKAEGLPEFG